MPARLRIHSRSVVADTDPSALHEVPASRPPALLGIARADSPGREVPESRRFVFVFISCRAGLRTDSWAAAAASGARQVQIFEVREGQCVISRCAPTNAVSLRLNPSIICACTTTGAANAWSCGDYPGPS